MTRRTKNQPITLKMISEAVGCSIAAASTVLNDSKGSTAVGKEMRQKILETANGMGYRPNFASRILKNRRSNTVGLYVQPNRWRGIGYGYESDILKGIEIGARKRGYDLLLLNMSAQVLPRICNNYLAESRIDGIILLHADTDASWIDDLLATGNPVVAIDCCSGKKNLNRIIFDNKAAIFLAMKTLYELGHRRIGFAGCCTQIAQEEDAIRENGFIDVHEQLGLAFDESLLFNQKRCPIVISKQNEYCQLEGASALKYFASMPNPPSAIVGYNSLVALSILYEAQKNNLNVPHDFSLIGFDDNAFFDLVHPSLTVIDHVLSDMGKSGVELLIDLIENKISGPCSRTFSPKIIKRNSTAKYQT